MEFYVQAALLGLAFAAMGSGIFISLRLFNFPDITTDGSFTLGAAVFAVSLLSGLPAGVCMLLAFVAGSLAGSLTGIIHAYAGVNSLLSGILVMTALYSVNLVIMGRSNLPLVATEHLFSGREQALVEKWLWLGGIIALLIFLLERFLRTDLGLALRASGSSPNMVRALGIDPGKITVLGLALSNGLVALSGALVAQLQGFADISMGIGIVIIGLGSVMIGESISKLLGFSKPGQRLLMVVLGAMLFRVLLAVSLAAGVDPNWLKALSALLVLTVVALPVKGRVSGL